LSGFSQGLLGFLRICALNHDESVDLHLRPKFIA
jgi:hypothetical protein